LIESALTYGREQIQIESRVILQDILNLYNAGIRILAVQLQDVSPPQEVVAAFKDVVSAREDRIRFHNEAEAYRNTILPRARGEAAEIINRAEAHRRTAVERATGEAQRFLSVLAEYNNARDITRKRMYIETMEEILASPGMEKIIIGGDLGSSVLPFLPLDNSVTRAGGR
jgi:membrane protease subunit HflK